MTEDKELDRLDQLFRLPCELFSRYFIFLSDMKASTPNKHVDYGPIEKAVVIADKAHNIIIEKIEEFYNSEKIKDLEASFTKKVSLKTPTRKFIMEGNMWKKCRSKDELYKFILFNDMCLYANEKGKRLVLHNKLPINKSFVVTSHDTIPNGLQILSSTKSFFAYTNTPEEKDRWLMAFNKCVAYRR
eukprot:UN31104